MIIFILAKLFLRIDKKYDTVIIDLYNDKYTYR